MPKKRNKKKSHLKIGFDLDGLFVDKPPLIPRRLIEWLFRGSSRNLHYRFPKTKLEKTIRKVSHHSIFRPQIKKNLEFLKKISQEKKYQLYLISARYSFLEERTHQWLKKSKIDNFFEKIFLNLKDEQPHFFKEKVIKDLKVDFFVDDDLPLISYLATALPRVKFFYLRRKGKEKKHQVVCLIESLSEIFNR